MDYAKESKRKVHRMLRDHGFSVSKVDKDFYEGLLKVVLLADIRCLELIQAKARERIATVETLIAVAKAKGGK